MKSIILQNCLQKLEETFIQKIYPDVGKCQAKAARSLFDALVGGGSTVVSRLAAFTESGGTASKGVREQVSGWLGRYDFAGGADAWMSGEFGARVGEDTVIAVDFSDISKEFGGKGMEGMQMGWDGSRKTTAMGHTFCAACAVAPSRDRVMPLRFCFEKGRKPLNERFNATLDAVRKSTQGKGIFVVDREGDSEEAISRLIALDCRGVVRVKTLGRDVFGTGRDIDAELARVPAAAATLLKPERKIPATVRWKLGFWGDGNVPLLVVESAFEEHKLHLYATLDKDLREKLDANTKAAAHEIAMDADADAKAAARERELLKPAALRAAQAYLDRWQIETFFQRVKQDFGLEAARVRTFQRLKNLFYLCVLGYVFFTHEVPKSAEQAKLLKILKDNFQRVTLKMQILVASLRALLGEPTLRFISGRPRKQAPPNNPAQLSFGW